MYGRRPPDVDERVWSALQALPRAAFVPEAERAFAELDRPLAIGAGQTISQPSLVALMTTLLDVGEDDRVLEVGTGSGFQAALLATLGAEVYSLEIVPELAERARATLERLGLERVHIRVGDGAVGWPEEAPFDGAVITAAAPRVPEQVVAQLRPGVRLVLPLGRDGWEQELVVVTRLERDLEITPICPVRFVPMVGAVRRP